MSHFKIINLPTHIDSRGSLTVIENILPFKVMRTYWIYDSDGQTRGGHRHKSTRQALVAVSGKVVIYMNDGVASENIVLDNPGNCLVVDEKDWHTMSFEDSAVLLVLSSSLYDPADYIDEPYA